MVMCDGCSQTLENPEIVVTRKEVNQPVEVLNFHREECLVLWMSAETKFPITCPLEHPHCSAADL